MTINQHKTRVFCPQLIRNVRPRRRVDISSIIAHPVKYDIPQDRSRKYYARTLYIATHAHIYILHIYRERDRFSISIGNTENHVATLTCLECHTVKICWHSHYRLIDNEGDYLYLKNQRMGASNSKLVFVSSTWDCTTFNNFLPMFKKKKKKKSWQVYDWLAKWLIMSGYMDLRRPRVYRRSNVGLVLYYC